MEVIVRGPARSSVRGLGVVSRSPEWARQGLVSIALALVIGIAALVFATKAGWIVPLDTYTRRTEVLFGVQLLFGSAFAAGVIHQVLSSTPRGAEMFMGQAVVLALYMIVGLVYDGQFNRAQMVVGLFPITLGMFGLCRFGALLIWLVKSRSHQRTTRR